MHIFEQAIDINALFQITDVMDQSKLYIPTPQKFVQFYLSDAKGDTIFKKRHTLPITDNQEKTNNAKMTTNLVSPTERSLEQVADVLKRKRNKQIKRRNTSKNSQLTSNKLRKQTPTKRKSKTKIRRASKHTVKDIFN